MHRRVEIFTNNNRNVSTKLNFLFIDDPKMWFTNKVKVELIFIVDVIQFHYKFCWIWRTLSAFAVDLLLIHWIFGTSSFSVQFIIFLWLFIVECFTIRRVSVQNKIYPVRFVYFLCCSGWLYGEHSLLKLIHFISVLKLWVDCVCFLTLSAFRNN